MRATIDSPVQPPPRTLADMLSDLGVDADRIRWHPLPGTATVKDAVRINERKDGLVELVEGVLVEKTMGFREGYLAIVLATVIKNFVDANDLGVVLGPDGMMLLFPKLLRMPDVSYISWARLNNQIPTVPAPLLSPDLAVEVLSAGNTKKEMKRKRGEYFKSGTKSVWMVDPKTKTIAVYSSPENAHVLTEKDVLTDESVLPGFSLDVKKLFGELNRKPSK